jgi:hypothetical protein
MSDKVSLRSDVADHFEGSRAMHVGRDTSGDREAISHEHDKAVHVGNGQAQSLGSASVMSEKFSL